MLLILCTLTISSINFCSCLHMCEYICHWHVVITTVLHGCCFITNCNCVSLQFIHGKHSWSRYANAWPVINFYFTKLVKYLQSSECLLSLCLRIRQPFSAALKQFWLNAFPDTSDDLHRSPYCLDDTDRPLLDPKDTVCCFFCLI